MQGSVPLHARGRGVYARAEAVPPVVRDEVLEARRQRVCTHARPKPAEYEGYMYTYARAQAQARRTGTCTCVQKRASRQANPVLRLHVRTHIKAHRWVAY